MTPVFLRPGDSTSSRIRLRGLPAALALCLIAGPALAQQAPADAAAAASLTDDRAEIAPRIARGALPSSMSLSDRALMLANDFNQLLLPAPPKAAEQADDEGGSKVRKVLQSALTLLGTPYRWGGTSPDSGFDCSGLVGYVFRNALGIELPRVSREMANAGIPVADRTQLAAGDLVFFGRRGRVDHVGIYVGEGRFVHAPRRGRDVTVSSLETGYWAAKFLAARRVEGI